MALEPASLAEAFEAAMPQAWQDVKNTTLPATDPNDRKPLFLAIARGLLKYLQDHQLDTVTTVDLNISGAAPATFQASNLHLNISGV